MKRLNINLTPDLYERVREYAFKERVSIAEIVRRALEAYINGP